MRHRWNYIKTIEAKRIIHVETFRDNDHADIAALIDRAHDYGEQVAFFRRPLAPMPPGSRIGFAMGCEGAPCEFHADHGQGKVCVRCHAKAEHVPVPHLTLVS